MAGRNAGRSKGLAMASGVLPSPVGRRVALVGDTHANAVWTCRVVEELAADGVDMVVQLGDFGWWPQSDFALKVSEAAVGAGITVCFIDGNHEDHEHLGLHADLRSPDRGRVDPVEMLPSLWYLPRGCAWQWEGMPSGPSTRGRRMCCCATTTRLWATGCRDCRYPRPTRGSENGLPRRWRAISGSSNAWPNRAR